MSIFLVLKQIRVDSRPQWIVEKIKLGKTEKHNKQREDEKRLKDNANKRRRDSESKRRSYNARKGKRNNVRMREKREQRLIKHRKLHKNKNRTSSLDTTTQATLWTMLESFRWCSRQTSSLTSKHEETKNGKNSLATHILSWESPRWRLLQLLDYRDSKKATISLMWNRSALKRKRRFARALSVSYTGPKEIGSKVSCILCLKS